MTIGILILSLLVLGGSFAYETMWKVETVDSERSEDGTYELILQSIGEPGWPFGSAPGRLLLKENGTVLSVTEFEIANDGCAWDESAWKVTWHKEYVEILLMGAEQLDEQIRLFFSGESERVSLSTRYGKEIETASDSSSAEEENHEEESSAFSPDQQRICEGYQAVFREITGNPTWTAEVQFGAKADSSSCILSEDENRVYYVMYDRDSENQNCGLYVYYQCDKNLDGTYSLANGQMQNIYAYVYENGEVIDSGKTQWSDAGTEAYRAATGE